MREQRLRRHWLGGWQYRLMLKAALIASGAALIAWNLARELDDLHKLAIALQSAGLPALILEGYRSFKKGLEKPADSA